MKKVKELYNYKASYKSNYDGDTVIFVIALGFDIYHEIVVRVNGIDCPELKGKTKIKGLEAKQFTQKYFEKYPIVTITTIKDSTEKFGRYLADIVSQDGKNLTQEIISSGNGIAYSGGKRT